MTNSETLTTNSAWEPSPLHLAGNLGILLLRVGLGIDFLLHGSQKLFGAFGGMGIGGTAGFFGFLGANPPGLWAVVVGLVEFLGGAALVLGIFSRIAAVAIAVDMVMAIALFNWSHGFFTETRTGGWEFDLVLLVALLGIALVGPGSLSLSAGLRSRAKGRVARLITQL